MTIKKFIDEQHNFIHRYQHEKISEVEDVIINREKSTHDIKKILNDLIFFYDVHFYTENKIIDSVLSKEDSDEHKKEHELFLSDLKSLIDRDFILIDVYNKIKKWHTNHIALMDSKLSEHLNLYDISY